MATFLYRLGRLAFRRRRLVLPAWIAVLVAAVIGVSSVSGSTTDDFTLPGTQSQQAIDLLEKEFPQASAAGAMARVVIEAPDGQKLTSAAHKREVESLVADLRKAPQVASVTAPFTGGLVSSSGSIAYAIRRTGKSGRRPGTVGGRTAGSFRVGAAAARMRSTQCSGEESRQGDSRGDKFG
ncbi:MMPL family transporter [Streptomyces sp. NPDC059863]|uniref:MMPL family transporter n=1 Tax=unclassified Streptomyces TaxID=2593676 RepID=UPI00364AF1AD